MPSTDWKRSRAFYVDTLGLRPDATGQAEFWVGEHVLRDLRADDLRAGVRAADDRAPRAPRRRRRGGPRRARGEGRRVRGRDLRHRRLPHGVLQRPGRQRPDAPPPLLAARGGGRVVITVERTDFVSVPVTDMERSIALLRRDARASARVSRRRAGRSSGSARTSRLYLIDPTNIGREFEGPHTAVDRASRPGRRVGAGRRSRRRASTFVGETFDTGVCHMALFGRPRRQRA